MPNKQQTVDNLVSCLKARVPLIVIRTIEPNRAREILAQVAASLRVLAFYDHSRTEGTRELATGQVTSEDVSVVSALEYARSIFKARENANFIFSDVDDLDSESPSARHMADMVRLAETRVGSIVLISSKPVWTGLARLGMSLVLDLPDQDELEDAITELIEANRGYVVIDWERHDVRRAAETLLGVTLLEATNILATVMVAGRLGEEQIIELSRYKDQVFGDLSGLERIHLDDDYEVGGLSNLKKWLEIRRELMHDDLSGSRVDPPRGVLLVGISGCGKSLSAKSIAQAWRLPLYRLDMASVFGQYLGQSESQLREALETSERMAPCVLWMDEIEKALSGGDRDGGTARRLVGQFLFWLQEHRTKVFLVATANDVTSLPPELLRKGRFDEMFFVDLPDEHDREEIIALHAVKRLGTSIAPHLMKDLVSLSNGFTGSDIEAALKELGIAQRRCGVMPSDQDCLDYFANIVPFSRTNAEELAITRAWGLHRCVPAGTAIHSVDAPQVGRRVLT